MTSSFDSSASSSSSLDSTTTTTSSADASSISATPAFSPDSSAQLPTTTTSPIGSPFAETSRLFTNGFLADGFMERRFKSQLLVETNIIFIL
uniref:Uncharacterized protein n=1 Tax=Cucumis melo TaxID=3656 RepID=A0A9I9ECC7_CUCME